MAIVSQALHALCACSANKCTIKLIYCKNSNNRITFMVFFDIDVVFHGDIARNTNYFLLLLQKMRTSCSFTFQTCTIQKVERNRQSVFWRTFASSEPFTPRNNIFRVKVIDYSATGTNNSGFCIGNNKQQI
jgi:hypothetical protein